MPYKVRKGGGSRPYKIVNKNTGKTVGSSKTKSMANKAIRARYANSKGK